jgi:hypothetical protein
MIKTITRQFVGIGIGKIKAEVTEEDGVFKTAKVGNNIFYQEKALDTFIENSFKKAKRGCSKCQQQ